MVEVEIEEQPIELAKLLKILDLVQSGGHAKLLIQDGYVWVNDNVCLQKRKKLFAGDRIQFDDTEFLLCASDDIVTHEPKQASAPAPAKPTAPKASSHTPAPAPKPKAKKKKSNRDAVTGRKPISFG